VEELAEVDEKLIELLLKASERAEKVLKEKLGERAQDVDLEISLNVGDVKELDVELEVKGLRAKYSYDEVVEEAIEEAIKEIDKELEKKD
jgi:uncharacterized protein (UPF0212 family)